MKLQSVRVAVDTPDVTLERTELELEERAILLERQLCLLVALHSHSRRAALLSARTDCLTRQSASTEITRSGHVRPFSDFILFTLFVFYLTTLLSSLTIKHQHDALYSTSDVVRRATHHVIRHHMPSLRRQ
jgi:hypothetical protein